MPRRRRTQTSTPCSSSVAINLSRPTTKNPKRSPSMPWRRQPRNPRRTSSPRFTSKHIAFRRSSARARSGPRRRARLQASRRPIRSTTCTSRRSAKTWLSCITRRAITRRSPRTYCRGGAPVTRRGRTCWRIAAMRRTATRQLTCPVINRYRPVASRPNLST